MNCYGKNSLPLIVKLKILIRIYAKHVYVYIINIHIQADITRSISNELEPFEPMVEFPEGIYGEAFLTEGEKVKTNEFAC